MNTMELNKQKMDLILTFMLVLLGASVMPETVLAWTTPAAGSFAYEVYDIGVVQILQGPIGFVVGIASVVLGAVSALIGKLMFAFPALIGGGVIIAAPSIVNSMGALI